MYIYIYMYYTTLESGPPIIPFVSPGYAQRFYRDLVLISRQQDQSLTGGFEATMEWDEVGGFLFGYGLPALNLNKGLLKRSL